MAILAKAKEFYVVLSMLDCDGSTRSVGPFASKHKAESYLSNVYKSVLYKTEDLVPDASWKIRDAFNVCGKRYNTYGSIERYPVGARQARMV